MGRNILNQNVTALRYMCVSFSVLKKRCMSIRTEKKNIYIYIKHSEVNGIDSKCKATQNVGCNMLVVWSGELQRPVGVEAKPALCRTQHS